MVSSPPPALRSQDLVFTLYGDYLLDRPAPVWVGSLIVLLGRLGLSSPAVRTVLSRMTRKGWLTAEPRSHYGLTARGRRLLEEGRERIYHPPRHEPWGGAWYLVTYSIPEARRRLRDLLRVKLAWLGCGSLSNGVWISPHDVRREVREIAESLRVSRHLEVFRAEHLGFATTEELVGRCWDLAAVNRRYTAFLARWTPELDRCRRCQTGQGRHGPGCEEPAECFVRRFRLVHEYRAFPLVDPYLPSRLLPGDWRGEAAARLFEACHDQLAEPARRYVAQVCSDAERTAAAA